MPDLSVLDEVGDSIDSELGKYSGSGLNVASVSCTNGESEYAETSDGFLSVDVNADGSGEFSDTSDGITVVSEGNGVFEKAERMM